MYLYIFYTHILLFMDTIQELIISWGSLSWSIDMAKTPINELIDTTHSLIPTMWVSSFIDMLVIPLTHTIQSSLWSLFYLLLFFWILIIIRTIKDAQYRSHSTFFIIIAILLVTIGTPLIGIPIYLAIRPIWYKYERAYWKAVMTYEENEEEDNVDINYTINELWSSDSDAEHLASLQTQLPQTSSVIKNTKKTTQVKSTPSRNQKNQQKSNIWTPKRRTTPVRK